MEGKKLRVEDLDGYRIDFSLSGSCAFQEREPDEFIHEINGTIVLDRAEGDDKEQVGWLSGYRLSTFALEQSGEAWWLCDAVSTELAEVGSLVFQTEGSSVSRWFEDTLDGYGDVLVLDRVKLVEAHRGKGVGLAAVWRFIEMFSPGCAVAVCQPFPLQMSCKVTKENEAEFLQAQKKLVQYWERLGFCAVEGTPLMYIDLAYKRPSIW